ncbi:putative beta-galactosidase [Lyophyllum shimeji]|uniref:beta-galactosidase n=1 Tax=Lyophyllum shimeji TaxID=47721 RepID=A0A9P3UT84_LYOSH|nr:putative beta-galactosidase [Lyophyllum shimeji]
MRGLLNLFANASIFVLVAAAASQWPVHNDGYTGAVQWDHYSLSVNGRRTFVWSGEFHYWRIPVPEVWRDLLEKIKAAGFNTVSVYSHWAFHAPNNFTIDFETGARNIAKIFELATEIGLFVTLRGGPYVNAETTAGGFALWTTTGAYGGLRDNDPRYTAAWTPFTTRLNQIAAKYQVTEGGTILLQQIENEICCQRNKDGSLNTPLVEYMVALENNTRENDVIVPIITNAPNMNSKSWSTDYLPGPGEQDLYGVDSYPACWSCNLAECGQKEISFNVVNYHDHFDQVSPTQPSFIPEFQGGSYNPWGGPQGGCPANLGPEFVNVFYRHLAAERITMASLYMLYGGTNWGGFATNLVGTSYDYSAPIQESRQIADKYYETKILGFFFRAAQDLTMTDRVGYSTSYTTDPTVGVTELRNPETHAAFYVARHDISASQNITDFKVNVATSVGNLTIPQFSAPVRLSGRQSKVLVTDFRFGDRSLVYSTAEVLSHSVVDGKSVLALWLPAGESGELMIKGGSAKREVVSGTGGSFHQVGENLVVSYTQQTTQSVLQFDDFRVLLLSRAIAYRFWAPTLTNDPIVSPEQVVFATGPYLVRSLTLSDVTARVTGDLDGDTVLEVFAPAKVTRLEWNGKLVATHKTSYGSLKATLGKPGFNAAALQKSLTLSQWKYADALPERYAAYDDSKWVVADHMSTPNPSKPQTLPVLYADDYGFHTGVQIFRGRFNGSASAATLNVQGGTAFGWSAWLNGDYIGSFPGSASAASGSLTLSFANATLVSSGENVLTVVMDHSGHDQRADALLPRGILGASLVSTENTTFSKWTLAGNAGGESNIDPVRGVIAEGGLHAERLGWHLPGFDDTEWVTRSPSDGVENATIGFFRTTSHINLPRGYDASLELVLTAPAGSLLRAQLYVNGYQYGKFVPQIGHQIAFPVPPGILNVRGQNVVGLNLWSQTAAGAKVDVKWNVLGVYESAWDPGFDAGYLQPGWSEERLQFA